MKFTTKGDIEAPLDFVFATLTDYDGWERVVRKRGATVRRSDGPVEVGTLWQATFQFRGKSRDATVRLASVVPDKRLIFVASGASVDAEITLDLIALNPKRTRLAIATEMKPRNLAARLFIQSLKLARGKIQQRFDQRSASLAAEIGARYRRAV